MKLKISTLKGLVLYNYRYLFAYFIVFLFAFYFLAWRLGTIAPGLSLAELQSASRSAHISSILNQPFYPIHSLLQWVSLNLLGPSAISIRLPSIVLAALSVLIVYSLLKKWFGKVTTLISVALLLSADWFLFIARTGTGAIEFSFWFVILVFSLMKLIEKKPNWLAVFAIASGFLLFAPYGIYAVLTTFICLLSCAMFRRRANEASAVIKTIFALGFVISISLIVWISYKDINFLKSLLGISQIPAPFEYLKNVVINSSGVAMIWPDNNPLLGPSGIFLIRFFEFIFMLFGIIMLYVTRVNRLSVVILANAVVLSLASGLSSGPRGGSLLIIPAIIFMTAGLRHFIHRWQRTFPKNPYARVALYFPLAILILTATTLHFQSYFVLWPRQAETRRVFSDDFRLLKNELKEPGECLIYNAPGYYEDLLTAKNSTCNVKFYSSGKLMKPIAGTRVITTYGKGKYIVSESQPRALTSSTKQNNVRWLVFQL